MSVDAHQQRLDAALRRRDSAQQVVQQLKGRLAAAEEDVATIERECAERGVPADKLDAAIAQLERRFETAMTDFEKNITGVETSIAPFLEDRT